MTVLRENPAPAARRGRPPARNEILRNGRLGGLPAESLAQVAGTPFYAYDLGVVTRQVERLRAALPEAFDLAYAVKANPNLSVVRHLAGLGLGADVASGGELGQAIRAGVVPERIVVTGPGKRDEELAFALDAQITVNLESEAEMERLARIAAAARRRARVAVRVNPDFQLKSSGMKMGGGAQQFGTPR